MATTAHLERFPANTMTPAPTRRSSSSREPSSRVRSILLSGNSLTRPPVHAHSRSDPAPGIRNASQSVPSIDVHTPAQPAPSPSSSPDDQAEVATETEGRPPSIHLSETISATVDQPDPTDARAQPDSDMPPPPMTATRTRRMTLDLPSSPIDVLFESDHKLALEGTSPKPCIVPGNALHLIDDDPDAPRSATPPSVIIVGDESEHGGEIETDMDGDEEGVEGRRSESQPPSNPARPTPRVRFRSRVRITSGVHRHRHSLSATGGSTPGSSTSDSPSSSISAPLRYQADENGAWGPIGKRLSAYASAGGWQRRTHAAQDQSANVNGVQGARAGRGVRGGRGPSERTPLLRPPAGRHMYSESEDDDTGSMGEDERVARAAALRREEEAVFGKWPWRIFNRHWWWWHVEPVLCCCCADDSDYDEY